MAYSMLLKLVVLSRAGIAFVLIIVCTATTVCTVTSELSVDGVEGYVKFRRA